MSIRFLSLFAGIGGFDLGLERAGWRCVGQVEINPFCRRVLEKHWPNVARFEDVREITGDIIRERCGDVDAVVGGFPCQDISLAGKGAGIEGERSGLWAQQYRIICELRPRVAVVENVAALLARGMGRVLGDLAAIGYDAEWSILSACALGAPHTRERVFILAYPDTIRLGQRWLDSDPTETPGGRRNHAGRVSDNAIWSSSIESRMVRVLDGVPHRMDRLGAIGNAIVPDIAQWIGERINAALNS